MNPSDYYWTNTYNIIVIGVLFGLGLVVLFLFKK